MLETTEAGLRLYAHLKTGPPFTFARVAWEAANVPASDLGEYLIRLPNGACRLDLECVLSDDLYIKLGSPEACHPFRPEYWWTRYTGERYQPLYSNDQVALNALCRQLFPEYFQY